MILRRTPRPQAISRRFEQLSQSTSCLQQRQQRRSLHAVPLLGHNDSKGQYFAANGVPGFLSPKTFRQTWTQYQQHLINQINSTTTDTEYAAKLPIEMHKEFSRQPERADFYNICAMAHFNHLWWESLTSSKKAIPESLRKDIEENFQSVDNLRTEMLEHADAMFGNGFVWLIKENSNRSSNLHTPLRILCTYNAGSPYAEAYRMRQSMDMSTGLDIASARMKRPQNTVGFMGQHSQLGREGSNVQSQLDGYPILCLNVWQHMWIPDYGIMGKRAYLAAWWERIDWDVVANKYNMKEKIDGYNTASIYRRNNEGLRDDHLR